MRVLVVGGSGYVAGLMLPVLARRHRIRVLDRRPPEADVEYLAGSATDHADLRRAVQDMDALVHCAMGSTAWDTPGGAADAFDVNVKSTHLALLAARDAGVRHAVYISSMSVYQDLTARRLDESTPPDATDLYGLTKRLGEQVCAAAVAEWGLSVNVLRLVWPTSDGAWPAWSAADPPKLHYTADGTPIEGTAATDLAAAVHAALEHRDGYQLFTISGARSSDQWSTAKARRVLHWTPTFGQL
jgi:nucleoside-diphosphate-sugar epimerase